MIVDSRISCVHYSYILFYSYCACTFIHFVVKAYVVSEGVERLLHSFVEIEFAGEIRRGKVAAAGAPSPRSIFQTGQESRS